MNCKLGFISIYIPKVNWMGTDLALVSLILVFLAMNHFVLILFAGLQTLQKDK